MNLGYDRLLIMNLCLFRRLGMHGSIDRPAVIERVGRKRWEFSDLPHNDSSKSKICSILTATLKFDSIILKL